jgi:hypothetical protein
LIAFDFNLHTFHKIAVILQTPSGDQGLMIPTHRLKAELQAIFRKGN